MNNAGAKIKRISPLAFCFLAGIFVFSCGLEEVIVVSDPTTTYNDPLYSSSDPLTWYFSFKTVNDSGDSFLGTDVYYKIYNNYNDLNSQRAAILAVNSSSNGSASANRMIETYSYQPLGKAAGSDVVFYPSSSGERVVIRLKTYQNGSTDPDSAWYSFNAGVGTLTSNNDSPRRINGKTFDFFNYNDTDDQLQLNVEPSSGDTDYYSNSSFSESNCYYVQMFAVGVATDPNTVARSYSLVLNLGSVPIRKGE